MSLSFENPKRFVRETLGAVTGAFALASLGSLISSPATFPEICAYALGGTFLGMAVALPQRKGRFRHRLLGVCMGAASSLTAAFWPESWGAAAGGLWMGCALGGLGLGFWLMLERAPQTQPASSSRPRMLGLLGGAVSAGLGVFGTARWLDVAEAYLVDGPFAAACIAGALGLWLSAGTGLRHLTKAAHPSVAQARTLLPRLQAPVVEMLETAIVHFETLTLAATEKTDATLAPIDTTKNTNHLAEALLGSMVQSATAWQNLTDALMTPQLQSVDDKLARLTQAREMSEDSIALAQLTRASQAVRAQQHALHSMETQKLRALANLEAQLALLERLHVAHLQFRLGDPQRFSVERDAVAEQVERFNDDFDAFSEALLEAEAYRDRDALAEVERTGRKALDRMRAQMQTKSAKAAPLPEAHRE